jgi:phospholipase/lecithinase/hemolysin
MRFRKLRLSVSTLAPSRSPRAVPTLQLQRLLQFSAVVLFAISAATAHSQQYTSFVIFGDSLSDTGNLAATTYADCGTPIPGPLVDYTLGRATDGFDTIPAARLFTGVWIEQLAALLPTHPVVAPSSVGGTNYAFGFATNAGGTSPEVLSGLGTTCTVNIVDIGQQITNYLGTHPKITKNTLFIVWGGANDLLNSTSAGSVIDAALKDAANVQRLIDAGATQFLIPNLPPLGETPAVLAEPSEIATANEASVLYNDTLSASLDLLPIVNFFRRLTIHRLNTYALFQDIASSPEPYFLANINTPAQGLAIVNPDTYLFWDTLHPTTKGHNLLALAALKLVDPSLCAALPAQAQSPPCASMP